jgi:hypothetical protein
MLGCGGEADVAPEYSPNDPEMFPKCSRNVPKMFPKCPLIMVFVAL